MLPHSSKLATESGTEPRCAEHNQTLPSSCSLGREAMKIPGLAHAFSIPSPQRCLPAAADRSR